MGWLYFALGFLTCGALLVVLILVAERGNRVEPTIVKGALDLQSYLRNLLDKGTDRSWLFVMHPDSKALVRIQKYSRKVKPDTLRVDIRNSDTNREVYLKIKSHLKERDIEFVEHFTPKLRKPNRIVIKYPDGGPTVVSAISDVLTSLFECIGSRTDCDLLVSDCDPYTWKTDPLIHESRT